MKYIVSVTRIGYGGLDLEVEADSEDKAKEIALNQAGGESFSEHHSDYQVDQVLAADSLYRLIRNLCCIVESLLHPTSAS